MRNQKIFEMEDKLKAAKDRKKGLDAQVKEVNAEIESLDLALSDAMAEAELDRFSRNGSTFYLNTRLFASSTAGRKHDLMQVLKDQVYSSIVVENVNANTLASFVKEQMAEDEDVIPEWLSYVISTFEKIRKRQDLLAAR